MLTDNNNQQMTNLILKSLTKAVGIVLILNVISLCVALFRNKGDFSSLAYGNGYFMINNNPVGIDIFSNIFGFLVFTTIIFWLDNKK